MYFDVNLKLLSGKNNQKVNKQKFGIRYWLFDELNGIMIKFGEADKLFLTLLLKYIISNRIWRLRKTLELEYLYELYQSDKLMKCEKKLEAIR